MLSLLLPLLLSHPTTASEICTPYPPPYPTSQNLTTCLDSLISSSTPLTPWTHLPHCIYADQSPHCVYTNAFHSISIITTPDEASTSLNLLSHSINPPFFAPKKIYPIKPYKVVSIPGKGKGAVATRRIQKGMAILVDTASILAQAEYPADVTREEVQDLMGAAVGRLRDGGEGVRALSRKGRSEEEDDELEDILLNNSFAVVLGGKNYMGLFVDVARFNHDCRPNAFIHFSETTFAMTIWAAKDIEEGEEITITYSAAGMLTEERQQTLEKVWGFKCKCSLCTASPSIQAKSDSNRKEIRHLQDQVGQLAQKGKYHEALKSAERMFELIETEGLTDQMGDMYEVPARLYYLVGNLEKALEYTLKVQNELQGYGVPGKFGMEKLRMLDGFIKKIERGLKRKRKAKEGRGKK
ncbi:hypothetical protein QBC38DRAFT_425404 [Podospora fimiseda]|uniref:SET domain-containing protein n=1 Tax=Podospora fimiseda TaxID=252190 RepID=A0AAN7BHS0_9PEZI|nr:hypothetical protein QBC38DRAFT_425404 [Podospora fimiseda]